MASAVRGFPLSDVEGIYFNNDTVKANDIISITVPLLDTYDYNARTAGSVAFHMRDYAGSKY